MADKVAAGFILFRRFTGRTEFLLLQASYGDHHWSPPKGHTDPGEDEMTAALRETEEETGFKKSDLVIYKNCCQTLQYYVGGQRKIVFYWLAELVTQRDRVVLSSEHENFKWLLIEHAVEHAQYKDMQNLLLKFNDYIKSNL